MPVAATTNTKALDSARAAFLEDAMRLPPPDRRALLSELERRSRSGSPGRYKPGLWPILTALAVVLYAAAVGLGHARLGGFCLYSAGEFLSDAVRYPADCQRVCSGMTEVPIERNISRSRFSELYAYTGRPVLIKGAADGWPAMQHWNLTFFRNLYDSYPDSYRMQRLKARYLPFRIELQTFREAMHMSEERQKQPYYFGWSNLDHNVHNELKKYFSWPSYLPLGSQGSVLDWIFIGDASFGAPVHLDHILRPSWQALIKGKKIWEIQPPAECSSVCKTLTVRMEPGDIFNVDTNLWYHATYILEGEFSITIGAEYD